MTFWLNILKEYIPKKIVSTVASWGWGDNKVCKHLNWDLKQQKDVYIFSHYFYVFKGPWLCSVKNI